MTKNSRPIPAGGRKEAKMRYHNGMWSYKGKQYSSLHDALVDNWPS